MKMISIKYNLAAYIAVSLAIFSCQTKTAKKSTSASQGLDTLTFNASNALGVRVTHGDSTKVVLNYGGPDVILSIDYFNDGKNSLNVSFGENSRVYPEVIML